MTDDVRTTCDWLVAAGFAIGEERYGSMHSGLVRFVRSDITVVVLSDRGEWQLDFEVDGKPYDLGAVVDTRMNRTEWTRTGRAQRQPPQFVFQHPVGVVWIDEVPASIQWLLSTPTAVEEVNETRRRRSKALWG